MVAPEPVAAGRAATRRAGVATRASYLALLILLVALPAVANDYFLLLAGQTAIFVIAVVGLNILTGMTGLISLGHAGFFAIGAYVTAVGAKWLGLPIVATLPLSVLLAALIGVLVGMPSLRVRGFYLAVATLSANLLILFILEHPWAAPITGGVSGIEAPTAELFGLSATSPTARYYLVIPFALAALVLMRNLTLTRIGRAFVAIRDHDISAQILVINLVRYKLASFAIAAAFGGLAGALWAYYFAAFQPINFGLLLSVQFLAAMIIGGQGTLFGPVLGTIFVVFIPELLKLFFAFTSGGDVLAQRFLGPTREIVFGALIIFFLIFESRGLAAIGQRLWFSTRRFPIPAQRR